MTASDKILIGAGVGVIAAVALYWLGRKTAAAVGDAAQAVNPTNPDNIFYGGVNAMGSAVSGDKGWTLGGWLYDVTHSGADQ